MSYPIFWPRKTFFYPVGNTPAVNLTQDIPPEEPANILLLGCGDVRNILFTVSVEKGKTVARGGILDITCCDIEPAVLARNVLLFTLIIDECPAEYLWNIFYHYRIDDSSLLRLITQSEKLVSISSTLGEWNSSKYSTWIHFCTEDTLSALHKCWRFYFDFRSVPKTKLSTYEEAIKKIFQASDGINMSASRSAGPFMMDASLTLGNNAAHYAKTGIVHSDPNAISAASNINPSFIYTSRGDVCEFHYGTYPLQGFHLAEAFTISVDTNEAAIISCAQAQFDKWCKSLKQMVMNTSASSIVIRLFAGDALSFCHTLHRFQVTKSLSASTFISPWRGKELVLSDREYGTNLTSSAPTSFQIIDTSNLIDHVGLLNLLIAAAPLLASSPSSTLYTEALLGQGSDAVMGFASRLLVDIPTFSLLFGIAPLGYLAGFNSASNIHELVRAQAMNTKHGEQYHERVSWKVPSAVAYPPSKVRMLPQIAPEVLAKLMVEINYQMFEANEDLQRKLQAPRPENFSSVIHYHRGTIIALFEFLRGRIQTDWEKAGGAFLDLVVDDRRLIFNTNFYQELCCQFHMRRICTLEVYNRVPKSGPFVGWDDVPPAVCVVLVVPRDKMRILDQTDLMKIGNPELEMSIRDPGRSQNSFSCIHIVIGRLRQTERSFIITEDPKGFASSSPLIVSAWVPSYSLTAVDPSKAVVGLSLHGTIAATHLSRTLGPYLSLFHAGLMDRDSVHILREHPGLPGELQTFETSATLGQEIGPSKPIVVGFDDKSQRITSMTVRQDITEEVEKSALASGSEIKQPKSSPSLLTASVKFAEYTKHYVFPVPIDLPSVRVRIARKSGYIELVASPLPPSPTPDSLYTTLAPIIHNGRALAWNMHQVVLSQSPKLQNPSKELYWLNAHVSLAMSDHERGLREAGIQSGLPGAAKKHAMVNIKDTIHTLFMKVYLAKESRIFALSDPDRGGGYCMVFVNDPCLDLSSHGVVLDCSVLPFTKPVVQKVGPALSHLVGKITNVITTGEEVIAWQYLLPTFAERCRSWSHKPTCEYISQGRIPLATEYGDNPLCSCGHGLDLGHIFEDPDLAPFKPFATRVAISPLFAVSYIQQITKGVSSTGQPRCNQCGKSDDVKLSDCGGCKRVKYCGAECQKLDWKDHKAFCKATRSA